MPKQTLVLLEAPIQHVVSAKELNPLLEADNDPTLDGDVEAIVLSKSPCAFGA